MDEARFGLHMEMRRVWISKGVRPKIRRQTRYEWYYLYGVLEVVEGRADFLRLPTMNLDCNDSSLNTFAQAVLSLFGRPWLQSQANATAKS